MTNSNFLPDDYVAPKTPSNYFKLVDGDNKFRILSSPILGRLDRDDKKPIRTKTKPEQDIDPSRPAKFFWAMVIRDYTEKKIKVRECTQRSIQQAIEELVADEDFGSPLDYDLKITKTGKNLETKYSIKPLPKKDVSVDIQELYFNAQVQLDKLYSGENPFPEVK